MLWTTVVLGMGNALKGDEGAGAHAVNRLRHVYSNRGDVVVLDGGSLSFQLAGCIEQAERLVVIDVAELRQAPGVVQLFEGSKMEGFIREIKKRTPHDVSLADLLTMVELLGGLPERRALIAVQPQRIIWSDTLSAPVERGVQQACDLARGLIERWCHGERLMSGSGVA